MPPSYSVSNASVVAVNLIGKHENQQVMTVVHYRLSAGAIVDDGRAMLNSFADKILADDRLAALWRACLSEKCVALRATFQWIHPIRYGMIQRSITPGQGAETGNAMPVNTSVAITRRTDFAGRTEVGTIHMPAVPITFITNGNVLPAAADQYNAFATESLVVISVTTPVAADFFPIPLNRSNFTAAKQFTNFALQPTARVERRRTVGLGS